MRANNTSYNNTDYNNTDYNNTDYYSELGEGYLELHREEQHDKLKIISSLIHPNTTDTLLDLGCGPGWASEFFKNTGCNYLGIDPSVGLIKIGQSKNINCKVGSAENLNNIKNSSIDFIICITVLHHTNTNLALNEISRTIKPNGKIVFSLLNRSTKTADQIKQIKQKFTLLKEIPTQHDIILLCKKTN